MYTGENYLDFLNRKYGFLGEERRVNFHREFIKAQRNSSLNPKKRLFPRKEKKDFDQHMEGVSQREGNMERIFGLRGIVIQANGVFCKVQIGDKVIEAKSDNENFLKVGNWVEITGHSQPWFLVRRIYC
ncbi:MAG: hypothetical protein MRZ79_02790 [Bacteroidia bacterium]|nr:hypothetical protein [Bacteroidia bacterium]